MPSMTKMMGVSLMLCLLGAGPSGGGEPSAPATGCEGWSDDALDASDAARFVTVAEGLTGARPGDRPHIGYRLHTAPDLSERMEKGEMVALMCVSPQRIDLGTGETLSLGMLRIVALDPLGEPIPAAPFSIEAEELQPSPVDFDCLKTDDHITGAAPGELRLRFTNLLSASGARPAAAEVTITVINRD